MIRDKNYWAQEIKEKKAFEKGQCDSYHLRDPVDIDNVFRSIGERKSYLSGYDSVMEVKRYL